MIKLKERREIYILESTNPKTGAIAFKEVVRIVPVKGKPHWEQNGLTLSEADAKNIETLLTITRAKDQQEGFSALSRKISELDAMIGELPKEG